MSVDKVIKSITKIHKQLQAIAEKQDSEALYLQERLNDAKEERDKAKKLADNFAKLLN